MLSSNHPDKSVYSEAVREERSDADIDACRFRPCQIRYAQT
jgi:hypothetical protein